MSELKLELEPWIDSELNIHGLLWIGNTIDVNSEPVPLLEALDGVIEGHRVGITGEVSKEGRKILLKVAKKLHKIADRFERRVKNST